jgi:hypothetical protein
MNKKSLIFLAALIFGFAIGITVYYRSSSNPSSQTGKALSTDTTDLAVSKQSPMVELKNGDTYDY